MPGARPTATRRTWSHAAAPGWFDVLDLTETDLQRPELYRTRALRSDFASGFGSSEDYLTALDIG